MKLFLVISDTHGDIFTAIEIIKKYPQINGIIHLGDYYKDANRLKAQFPGLEFFIVPGNCDFVFDMPSDILLDIEGKRLLLTHGHRYDVKNGLERLEIKAKKENADAVLFGHTHTPYIKYRTRILFVNPGSLYYSRSTGAKTYALLEVSSKGIEARGLDA
ncbi:MAG: metallophosphoesterase [Clostridiaceae bacterium]|jgi:putative phosphoesterase|nr:metallophosphoesterase [Clostridiaceae bacterium]